MSTDQIRLFEFDLETQSAANLPDVGAWRYSIDPSTKVLCMAYSIDGNATVTLLGDEMMNAIRWALSTPGVLLVAHNVFFEISNTVNQILKPFNINYLDKEFIKKFHCTASQCRAAGLPGNLESAAKMMELPHQKDMHGHDLMMELSHPKRRTKKDTAIRFWSYAERQADYDYLYNVYCPQDVKVEHELYQRVPQMSADERQIFWHDLLINLRGIRTDPVNCRTAIRLAEEYTAIQNKEIDRVTGGAIKRASQGEALKKWLASTQGCKLGTLGKDSLKVQLPKMSLTNDAAKALVIRSDCAKSSVSKYKAILRQLDPRDNRIRGQTVHFGASTGRFNGKGVQVLNLPKGDDDGSGKPYNTQRVVDVLEIGSLDIMQSVFPRPLHALSAGIRRMLTASPGKQLYVGDYSAIENRILLWICGQEDVLQLIRNGADTYLDMAETLYNRKGLTKKDNPIERKIGKEIVLACGFQMGADRFFVRLQLLGVGGSLEFAQTCVNAFRLRYYKVKQLWYATERAIKECLSSGGVVQVRTGSDVQVWYSMDGRDMLCHLPSGRKLRYFRPYMKEGQVHCGQVNEDGRYVETVLYGGLATENYVQATARDVAVFGMQNCERAGYQMLFLPHDECVTEKENGNLEEFKCIMNQRPSWLQGCPLGTECWTGDRYQKVA